MSRGLHFMARLTDRQLRQIAHDLLPCDHGRNLKLGEIAQRNGITRQTLNKLLNKRHSHSSQMYEYMERMRVEHEENSSKKQPKTRTKASKK